MIIVTGTLTVPQERHDAMVAAIAGLSAATRGEEGCVDYGFWADLEQRGRFHVFEVWASGADLAAHSATPNIATFRGDLARLGGRVTLKTYEARELRPV